LQVARAEDVAAGRVNADTAGCHGPSPLIEACPWLDYNNTFRLGVAYCLTHDISKFLLDTIFTSPPRGQPRQLYQLR
jgi:hypothetical protein